MTDYNDKQIDFFRELWDKEGNHLSRNETIERMESAGIEPNIPRNWTFDCHMCNGEALPEGWQPDNTALRVRCSNCKAVWFEPNHIIEQCPHSVIKTKKTWEIESTHYQEYWINYEKAVLENTVSSKEPDQTGGSSTKLMHIECAWCEKVLFDGEGHGPTDLAALQMSLENWDKIVDHILIEKTEFDRWPLKGEIKDK